MHLLDNKVFLTTSVSFIFNVVKCSDLKGLSSVRWYKIHRRKLRSGNYIYSLGPQFYKFVKIQALTNL